MLEYSYNNQYLMRNNKPWFPVMGEFHYSRYPEAYWKESLYKMKSGGVDIVSAYTIWIHHEEIEGEYDFSGQRNLRKFVETVKECGLQMCLRIGPWAHGEARNGGFPDWLVKKPWTLRSNDPNYLACVKKWYQAVYAQVDGFLLKDGGPIMAVQIENEYNHCGPAAHEGTEEHMQNLKRMAVEAGFEVPLYTATGWGGALTGGMLPVMGGYCDAPWDQSLERIAPSGNFVFTYERNDHNIGSDYGFGHGITFDIDKFPYLTAELGGGLQVTHHRRPVATGADIGAMSLAKVGSGCSLLGYYMYHGGTNPDGKLTTLQESRETGYPNDLPIKSYDFNAPIKEFGQLSDSYREVRLLATFLKDFGSELAQMKTYIPSDSPLRPENFEYLRTSVRRNEDSGYLFVNNYQKNYTMAEHKNVELKVALSDEMICFAPRDIHDRDYFFLPFNMKLNETAVLKRAMVTPLCRLNGNTYVFYGDCDPDYMVEGDLGDTALISISRKEALNAKKVTLDKEYLLISDSDIIVMGDGVHFEGTSECLTFTAIPALSEVLEGFEGKEMEECAVYTKACRKESSHLTVGEVSRDEQSVRYVLDIHVPEEKKNDVFITLDYDGDGFQLYLDGALIEDGFYTGQKAEIGLKRFGYPEKLELEVSAMKQGAPVYLEKQPNFIDGVACKLNEATIHTQWDEVIK